MNELEQEYQNIRKLFFPRWDKEGLWRVSSNPPEDGKGCFSLAGYCDPDNKIIHVMTDSEGYSLTLAHEICHAVTTQSHEKKWFQRMMKANVVADQLGNNQLATEIREDADMFAAAPRLSADYIGSAEKHFALIQVTDIIYDSSWSAPTEGSQSASFSSKPLKNLALWCRK